jgi:hypothetical protein
MRQLKRSFPFTFFSKFQNEFQKKKMKNRSQLLSAQTSTRERVKGEPL